MQPGTLIKLDKCYITSNPIEGIALVINHVQPTILDILHNEKVYRLNISELDCDMFGYSHTILWVHNWPHCAIKWEETSAKLAFMELRNV